jgi:hypothetical protein
VTGERRTVGAERRCENRVGTCGDVFALQGGQPCGKCPASAGIDLQRPQGQGDCPGLHVL